MTRRIPLLLCALGVTAALSACSTFDSGAAARVNGQRIDDRLIRVLLASPEEAGAAGESAGSALNGDDARAALGNLIEAVVARDVAERYDIDLAALRAASLAQIESSLTGQRLAAWKALNDDDRALIADYSAALEALSKLPLPTPDDLEVRYANPESTGYFCLRYIAFTDETAANAAAERLEAGEEFAAVATSVDPESNGGEVTDQAGSPCVRLDQFRAPGIPTELVRALYDATPGAFVGPVRAAYDMGDQWFLLLHRPYGEIAEGLAAAVASAPALADFYATLATTSASVASRYGTWDSQNAAVVAQP